MLEAEVVVEPARAVHLDDEAEARSVRGSARVLDPGRLRGGEGALLPVAAELRRSASRGHSGAIVRCPA